MTASEMPALELAGRMALLLGLAVFLGLAFEEVYKREARSVPGGVRTFPMLGMSGAMLFLIEPHYAFAFIAGLLALAAWMHAFLRIAPLPGDMPRTLMIPASNLLAYVIGPVALMQSPWLSVGVAVTAVVLLGSRERMHHLAGLVPHDEMLTAVRFLVLTGVVLPLVPHQPITSVTPLTPYQVWLTVVVICGLAYASYLLQRYVPIREGALLPAVLGGLYSSTATTVVLAKGQREAGSRRSDLAAGIVAATSVMYIRLGILVAFFNVRLAVFLAPALVGLFVIGATMTAIEWLKAGDRPAANLSIPTTNPLQVTTAVTFAILFVLISVASTWIRSSFGQAGVFTLAVLVGAADIDPFVLNLAQGGISDMPVSDIAAAILIATSANNVVKAAYALAFGGLVFSLRPATMLVTLALLGFAAAGACAFGTS